MAQRRGFGSIRKLPSGRWQARFTHSHTGQLEAAPSTFATKADANRWLSSVTDADNAAGGVTVGRSDALDLAGAGRAATVETLLTTSDAETLTIDGVGPALSAAAPHPATTNAPRITITLTPV